MKDDDDHDAGFNQLLYWPVGTGSEVKFPWKSVIQRKWAYQIKAFGRQSRIDDQTSESWMLNPSEKAAKKLHVHVQVYVVFKT